MRSVRPHAGCRPGPRGDVGRTFPVILLSLALLSSPARADPPRKPVWLVVTREMFTASMRPLAEVRRRDGFEVVVSTRTVAEAVGELDRRPAFIVLVGDDEPEAETQSWYLPTRRFKPHGRRAGRRGRFASDAAWGDLDGDLIPDVPVGRIPARSTAQLGRIVRKIIAYERRPPSLDDLRLPVWAGAPEFNAALDAVTTGVLLKALETNAPRWAEQWVMSSDPGSVLCGVPEDQPALWTQQIKRGGLLSFMIGHGSNRSFHGMVVGKRLVEFTGAAAMKHLATGSPGPPMVILACETGDFAGYAPCVTESLLFLPGGPVATIAATTISHPLTNGFTCTSLLKALGGTDRRVGTFWFNLQRGAAKRRNALIDGVAGIIERRRGEDGDIAKLWRDHLLMYAILGDPATRLRLPERLHGKIRRRRDGWYWEVHRPAGTDKLHVSFRRPVKNRPGERGELTARQVRRRFHAANDAFTFKELPAPGPDEPWKGVIREEGTLRLVAMGSDRIYAAALTLKRPPESAITSSGPAEEGEH